MLDRCVVMKGLLLIKGTAALRVGVGKREGSMQGKVTQPHGARPLGPQEGNSASLLALSVLAEMARHLASVLIKVGNQFGDSDEENGSEILMATES